MYSRTLARRRVFDPGEPELLTVAQAASALGVTRQTIYHHIRKGGIEAREVDGQQMVSRSSLAAYSPLGAPK